MRFLTRDWMESEGRDEMWLMNLAVYQRHLEDIIEELPDHARTIAALTMGHRLAGADVSVSSLDVDECRFKLVLRVDTIGGDQFLELEYKGVDPDDFDAQPFEEAESLLTDEFDLGPNGTFEHRLLFEPGGEGSVFFKDLIFRMRADEKHDPDDE